MHRRRKLYLEAIRALLNIECPLSRNTPPGGVHEAGFRAIALPEVQTGSRVHRLTSGGSNFASGSPIARIRWYRQSLSEMKRCRRTAEVRDRDSKADNLTLDRMSIFIADLRHRGIDFQVPSDPLARYRMDPTLHRIYADPTATQSG